MAVPAGEECSVPSAGRKPARLYFEVGIGQADSVLRIMRRQGFGELEIVPDTAGIPRVVYGTLYNEI